MASNKQNAGKLVSDITGIKTYDMVQYVTAPLEGEISDWPANIQDAIYEALEKKAQEVEHPLTIVHSRCDVEPADDDRSVDKLYVHVVASEIVLADERKVNADKDKIREMIADIVAGRRTH